MNRAQWLGASALCLGAALAFGGTRPATAKSETLADLVDRFRLAKDEEARRAAREAIGNADPKWDELLETIRDRMGRAGEVARGRQTVDIGEKRPLELYVPESYDPRKRAWPLLIALHGTGGDGAGMIDRCMPEAQKRGWLLAAPSLPDSDIGSALAKASSTGFGWGDHDENLALQSLRWILRRYRVDTDKVMLMGVSQGGYGAWGIGTIYAHRWAAVLPYAGGIDHRENFGGLDLIQKIPAGYKPGGLGDLAGGGRRRDLLKNVLNVPVFFVHGGKDDVVKPEGDRKSAEELKALGYRDWKYVEKPDWGHVPKDAEEILKLVEELLTWADEKERDANPAHIVHFAPRSDSGTAWWVELEDFDEGAFVEASCKRNVIQIETRGVRQLTVQLNEDLVKLDKKLKIAINGKAVVGSKVKPTAENVLDSYEESWDPARTYPVRITINVP